MLPSNRKVINGHEVIKMWIDHRREYIVMIDHIEVDCSFDQAVELLKNNAVNFPGDTTKFEKDDLMELISQTFEKQGATVHRPWQQSNDNKTDKS